MLIYEFCIACYVQAVANKIVTGRYRDLIPGVIDQSTVLIFRETGS